MIERQKAWSLVGRYSLAVPTPRNNVVSRRYSLIRRLKCQDRCALHRTTVSTHALYLSHHSIARFCRRVKWI